MHLPEEIEFTLIREEDATDFWNLIQRNRDHLKQFFPVTLDQIPNLSSTENFIRYKLEDYSNKKGEYFLIRTGTRILGVVSLKNIEWRVPKCEIAYFIDKDLQGNGIISYAISWVTDYCFRKRNMLKVYAVVGEKNLGSKTVLLKNGFIEEGLLINDYRDGNGNLTNSFYFAKHSK